MSQKASKSCLSHFLNKFDKDISNLYSSKQSLASSLESQPFQCSCIRDRQMNVLEVEFYENQLKLVSEGLTNLAQQNENEMIWKFMGLLKENIERILVLLNKKYLCECKMKIINESKVQSHKINFLRQENDKLVILYEQKCQELDKLKSKVKQRTSSISKTNPTISELSKLSKLERQIAPITLTQRDINSSRVGDKFMHQLSVKRSDSSYIKDDSQKDSRISEMNEEISKLINRHSRELLHQRYFQNCTSSSMLKKPVKHFEQTK